jgi:hypothetical protein
MTERNNSVPAVIEVTPIEETFSNKVVVPIHGQDYQRNLIELDLSFDSTESEVLERLRPILVEEFGVDIRDERTGWLYKMHKAVDRQNIYLIPNSVAGLNYTI